MYKKGNMPWSKINKGYKIKDTSKWKETKNFLGHKHTEKSNQKNREKHSGKKQTEETLQKKQKSRKLFFENGGVGGMKDKKHSEITKQKMRQPRTKEHRQHVKEAVNKSENKKKNREWHINHPNKKFSDTSIELKMRAELDRRGFIKDKDYFCNVGLSDIANVDFYLPEYRIIIECDGDYWHDRPGAKENDERKTEALQKAGYIVYRFLEHEINKSAEECINQIKFLKI